VRDRADEYRAYAVAAQSPERRAYLEIAGDSGDFGQAAAEARGVGKTDLTVWTPETLTLQRPSRHG
jgi:hypothetical protein